MALVAAAAAGVAEAGVAAARFGRRQPVAARVARSRSDAAALVEQTATINTH